MGLLASVTEPSLFVTPTTPITYFDAMMNQGDTKPFTIANKGNQTLHIDSVQLIGSPEFTLSTLPTMELAPSGSAGDSIPMTATFTPTSNGGATARIVVIAGSQSQQVRLIGGLQPQLQVTWIDQNQSGMQIPPVDWGTTSVGDSNDARTVHLVNAGSADLDISAIVARDITNTTASGSFTVAFTATTLTPGQSKDVSVVFTDDVSIRNDTGKLAISSNDPVAIANGGAQTVDLHTTNDPAYKPNPKVTVSASPQTCHPLTLDGSSSSDPQSYPITYKWAIAHAPNGSHITLTAPTAASTDVVSPGCNGPDVPGNYAFTLTVDDQFPQNANSISQAVSVQ